MQFKYRYIQKYSHSLFYTCTCSSSLEKSLFSIIIIVLIIIIIWFCFKEIVQPVCSLELSLVHPVLYMYVVFTLEETKNNMKKN